MVLQQPIDLVVHVNWFCNVVVNSDLNVASDVIVLTKIIILLIDSNDSVACSSQDEPKDYENDAKDNETDHRLEVSRDGPECEHFLLFQA